MYVKCKKRIEPFEVSIADESGKTVTVHILPPKVSLYEKIQNMDEKKIVDIKDILLDILNNNKEKTEVTEEFFNESIDIISMNCLFSDIVDWINNVSNDPN